MLPLMLLKMILKNVASFYGQVGSTATCFYPVALNQDRDPLAGAGHNVFSLRKRN